MGYDVCWHDIVALPVVTIATLRGEPEKAVIFAYEKGATMRGEFLAPARRVSFFLWQDGFEQLAERGWTETVSSSVHC